MTSHPMGERTISLGWLLDADPIPCNFMPPAFRKWVRADGSIFQTITSPDLMFLRFLKTHKWWRDWLLIIAVSFLFF